MDIEAIFQQFLRDLEVRAPVMRQGVRKVQGMEGRRRGDLTQTRFIGEQRENVLHIVAAGKRVLHQLVREALTFGTVMAVLLILARLLVVRETDDIVFATQHDIACRDQQRGHVTATVHHGDERDRMVHAVGGHIIADRVDLVFGGRDVQVGLFRQSADVTAGVTQRVKEVDVVDERGTHVGSGSRIAGHGRQHIVEVQGFANVVDIVVRQNRVPDQVDVVICLVLQEIVQIQRWLACGLIEVGTVVNEEGTTLEHRATVVAQHLHRHVQQRVRRVALVLAPIDVGRPFEAKLGEMLGEGHLMLACDFRVVLPQGHVLPVLVERLRGDQAAAVCMPVGLQMRGDLLIVHGFARVRRDAPEIHILAGHGFEHLLERVNRAHDGVVQAQHFIVGFQLLPADGQQRLLVRGDIKPRVLTNHDDVRVFAEHLAGLIINLAIHDDDEIGQVPHQILKEAIEELRRTTVLIVETEYAQPLGRRIVYKSHLLIPFTVHNILAYKPFHNLSHPSRKGYNRLHLLMQLPPTTALNLLQVLGQIIYVRYAMLFHIARYSTQRVHVRGNKQRSVTLPSVHGIPQINNDLRVRIQEEVRSVHLQRSVIPTMAFNPIDLQISDDAGRLSEIHTSRPLAMWHMYLNRVVLLQPLFLLQYIACSKNISFTSERLYRLLVEGGIGIGKSTMRSYIFANHFLRFYEIFSVYPVANRFPMLLSNAFLIDSLKSVADGVASNKIVSMRGLKLHSR